MRICCQKNVAHGEYRIHVTVHLMLLFVYSHIYDYQLLIYNITEDVVGLYIKSILNACEIFEQSHKFRDQGMAHSLCIFLVYSTTHKIPLIVYCQMVGWLTNSELERL
jgi:hypothetical protein